MTERPARDPLLLAARLGALEVVVERVRVDLRDVAVPSYGEEARPSSVIVLEGRGECGRGENVGWTREAHERFREDVSESCGARTATVADWLGDPVETTAGAEPPYARAAIEAACIDLALRQHRLTLAALTGIAGAKMRYAISFDASLDPATRVRELRSATPDAVFKVDVDPRWSDEAVDALAALGPTVAVLDFKERGDRALVLRLAERFPGARLEDPPLAGDDTPPELRPRIARDMPLRRASDVQELATGCGAINVKAPRMGGFLEVLAALGRAEALGLDAYFGGMFEVDVGRAQARQLAALFTPAARNDLAPIPGMGATAGTISELQIALERPGFGGD